MKHANGEVVISRRAATKAGQEICQGEGCVGKSRYDDDLQVAQRWRAQHAVPSRECFGVLLETVASIPNAVCTYRLKRFSSMMSKLRRPGMHFELGALDDIGGCRVIVDTPEQVDRVVLDLKSRLKLKAGNPEKDYIREPQKSGYRSHHLFAMVEEGGMGYRVEIQVRTRLEHYWATAVEAMSEIYGHDYKSPPFSSAETDVDGERREFLSAVSALFALREKTPVVPGFEGMTEEDVVRYLGGLSCAQNLMEDLCASADSVFQSDVSDDSDDEVGSLFLLKFSRENQNLDVEKFAASELGLALACYDSLERCIDGFEERRGFGDEGDGGFDNVVLAYAQNPKQLKIAYPNYSANISKFVNVLKNYDI